jgi:diguanylate cyclase (GGDEF)-like protein
MKSILRHVERITRHRDQALLDISIAQALTELIPGSSIHLHALRSAEGVVFATRNLRCSDAGCEYWGENDAAEAIEIPVTQDALLAHCLARGTMVSRQLPEGGRRTVFPLKQEDATVGLLEFESRKPLSRSQQHLVQGFLALHRNFMDLLRYSQVDALTGLLNRKTFDENLRRYLTPEVASERSSPGGRRLPTRRRHPLDPQAHWLGVIDIDHFKRINDQFGHLYGDEVLILLAKLMKESFRQYDKLFRFGGEEFVVVLRSAADDDAHRAFERFRRTVEGNAFPQVGRVTVSIGFTRIQGSDPPADIIGRADDALYHAKENGRNQVHLYEALVAAGRLKPKRLNTEAELF